MLRPSFLINSRLKCLSALLGLTMAIVGSFSPAMADKVKPSESPTMTETEQPQMNENETSIDSSVTTETEVNKLKPSESPTTTETGNETSSEAPVTTETNESPAMTETGNPEMNKDETSSESSEVKETNKAEMNLVETAIAAGKFETLVAALKAAGLVENLSGEGPFTIFAPTDEAFAALGEETVKDLLKPENKAKLTAILTYHVVPGMVMSKDLKTGEVKTVEGSMVRIELGDSVKANDATVLKPDIMTSNGVIHVIDQVILPPNN
ncbi:fasciclin domain-containing protein [Crocosphaera sp. UHCC 0190]|uniref:fasciclin domain-containing protein n=1 Tax=Crocosphaera sp. UHCC 0190 TaxID=3110246 RepID=UPI002B1F9539|nr:fasciclin domain-containing protein [Crocosphaera sp. UHCC 0190]MEA5508651.1 fasciclin domain-containing protein [Crocosphaera sp. UHCC 0190]